MKKLMLGLICFVCLLVFFHTHISFFVDAKEVESPWVLTEDIVIDGENPEYEKIIVNKDKSIFTPYNNKIYVLIKK